MRCRTASLCLVAVASLLADADWAWQRLVQRNASITFVGLDSVDMIMPASARAAQFRDGRWDTDPYGLLRPNAVGLSPGHQTKPMAYVGLGEPPSYGRLVEVVRDLKARHVCHVLVRGAGQEMPGVHDFGKGPEPALIVPSFVLCGSGYGDAGFYGRLPADRLIHVDE